MFAAVIVVNTQTGATTAAKPAGTTTAAKAPAPGGATNIESITNYVVENFEMATAWEASMPRDQGIVSLLRKEGGPNEVRSKGEEMNKYILGLKVEYFRTGYNWFSTTPPRKIKVPGVTKQLNVWVAGRNYEHRLSFVITDFYGQMNMIGNEKLNFTGWKQITAQVSPFLPQDEYHSSMDRGIHLVGLRVECDPLYTHGKYYVYFDDITADTDLYLENYKDADDPSDDW
ncbi:MAG: flagellar filament protein FlaA [Spirochaetes bacterium]|nr:flagellar filament protein FlaA [Spirochaetota bacterium]